MSHRVEHLSDTEEVEKTNEQEITGNKRELTMTGPEAKRKKEQSSPSTPSKNRIQQPSSNSLPTPSSRRSWPLLSNETSDRQTLNEIILSEARGQIRKSVPYSKFHDRFLSRLKRDVVPCRAHITLFEGLYGREAPQEWEEKTFHNDVLKTSMETMCKASLLSTQGLLLSMLIAKTRI